MVFRREASQGKDCEGQSPREDVQSRVECSLEVQRRLAWLEGTDLGREGKVNT